DGHGPKHSVVSFAHAVMCSPLRPNPVAERLKWRLKNLAKEIQRATEPSIHLLLRLVAEVIRDQWPRFEMLQLLQRLRPTSVGVRDVDRSNQLFVDGDRIHL